VLIIGTIVVASQISYFRNVPLGFTTDAIVNIDMPNPKVENLEAFRARLQLMPEVDALTFCLGAPTSENSIGTSMSTPGTEGKDSYSIRLKTVDIAYLDTYGMELTAGRWITEAEESRATTGDYDSRSYVFVVNESLVDVLGVVSAEEAIGKEIIISVDNIRGEIIGVVKDFHTKSLRTEIEPVVIMNFPFFYYSAGLRIASDDIPGAIKKIEKAWSEIFPEYLFDYTFLDDHLASLYEEEAKTFTLVQVFSGISIFIGCIGLFGLISFIVAQRMKEIGVRKVLGASVPNIIFNLSKEFLYLELVAFAIAVPIAWYSMNSWLEGFAYRIDLNPLIFLSGLIISLIIALATVGVQALKAARANPVDALKDE
jgi:putative ABC transport system permease protein